MKPAWDQLGAEYKDHPSVLIGDADCTASGKELCNDVGVSGYPTIKYYDDEGEHAYQGGRDFDALKKFVVDTLEPKCSVAEQDGCSEKEKNYIAKMQGKTKEEIAKQLARMEKMKSKSMKASLKRWVNQRHRILSEL